VSKSGRVPKDVYEAELLRMQGELVEMQEWVRRPARGSWSCSRAATPPARAG
jgi:hypothetical protein